MAAKAKFVNARSLEIFTRSAPVWIVAIDAGHLSFPNRMMVGKAAFRSLRLMALQAGFIRLRPRPESYAAFRSDRLHHRGASAGCGVEGTVPVGCGLEGLAVDLVAIRATDVVHRVRAIRPVPHLGILRMTTEADAICVSRRTLVEADDLAFVATAFNVKAAVSVAVFTFHSLLGVEGVTVSHGLLIVTGRAYFCTHAGRTRDFDVFSVGLEPVCCVLGGRRLSASASGERQQKGQAEAVKAHRGPPVA